MQTIENLLLGSRRTPARPSRLPAAFATLLLFWGASVPQQATARGASAAVAPASNRYLLVIETSRATRNQTNGVRQVVNDLLTSGMVGQLQTGDTVGLWTFNSEVYAGRFPLQDWWPSGGKTMSMRVLAFLDSQPCEKKPHLEKVVPLLQQVVQDSDFITIIVVSSGESPIQGTPFDERINTFFTTWRKQQQTARMPFVTVLRAEHGKLADCSVDAAPWQVELPKLPPELLAARAPKKQPALAVVKAPPPAMLPPLIISGKKQPHAEPSKPAEPTPVLLSPNPAPATAPLQATQSQVAAITLGVPDTKLAPIVATTAASPQDPPPSALVLTTGTNPSKKPTTLGQQPAALQPVTTATPGSNPAVTAVSAPAPTRSGVVGPTPQAISASPSVSFSSRWVQWLAIAGCLGIGGLLLVIWRGRARPRAHMSLITRSFGQDK